MRVITIAQHALLVAFLVGCSTSEGAANQTAKLKAKCADFGFQEGTDEFANCVMKLSLREDRNRPLNHFETVDKYTRLSIKRKGDDRYSVCSAGNMDAELDIESGKWVGPNCQIAPD